MNSMESLLLCVFVSNNYYCCCNSNGSGSISLGRVLDKLRDDLDSIIESPELIYGECYMMGLMTKWAEEIPDLKLYRDHQYNNRK